MLSLWAVLTGTSESVACHIFLSLAAVFLSLSLLQYLSVLYRPLGLTVYTLVYLTTDIMYVYRLVLILFISSYLANQKLTFLFLLFLPLYTSSNVIIIYLSCLLGFGIAMACLLPQDPLFNSTLQTSLTLFNTALGNPDFLLDTDISSSYQSMGLFLLVCYCTISFVILLNYLVAVMTVSVNLILGCFP